MSLQSAMDFIKDIQTDKGLRKALYHVPSREIMPHLNEKGYDFTLHEFEESINLLHVKCQTEEEANLLFEVVNWFVALSPAAN